MQIIKLQLNDSVIINADYIFEHYLIFSAQENILLVPFSLK